MRLLGIALWGLVVGLVLDAVVRGAWASPEPASVSLERPELVVLHRWDAARAAAYDHGDARALRALYVRGSTAARADAAILRAYSGRGLRVHGLTTQVFGVRVLISRAHRIRLVVVERVAGGFVAGRDQCWALPRDRANVRAIDFREVAGTWRVASVARKP